MLAVTLAGGLAGALLLLWTPSSAFDLVLPWLLLIATLALAFGPKVAPWMQSRARLGPGPILVLQFALGVYGGYFGGAVGLMMVAAWGLLADVDLKRLNPPRTLMVSAANTIAVLCFAAAGAVRWRETLVLGAAAIVGGYAGAHLGRRLNPRLVRAATLTLSVAMTSLFFLRAAR